MKQKLNVPLVRQPENSVDCGIAGITMIMKYHGLNIDFEEVKKNIITDSVGSYIPQLGTYLLKKGFEVEIITLHPKLFTLNDEKLKQSQILKRMQDFYSNTTSEQEKKVSNYFISFLKEGGKIRVKIPDINDVKKEINNKTPLCASLTSRFMNITTPKFNFHFNVITGYDDKYIYVNDPAFGEIGGEKKYLINNFFYGMYASAFGDLDNACLLIVKKKLNKSKK